MGHEYINCHRALRQLATRLCEAGFPVLRFDYYGCGDSFGNDNEGTVERWLEDTSLAICEIRRRSDLAHVCVVGIRLGAALAMISGARRRDLESLILWDPAIDGNSYLKELQRLQKEMSRFRPRPKSGWKSADRLEVLGFPIPYRLRVELEKLNLLAVVEAPAKNVLVVESKINRDDRESSQGEDGRASVDTGLKEHLSQSFTSFEYQRVNSPQIWLPTANGSLLVPSPLLQSVVAWVCRMHS
jgi:pimeloyl-ACP methyl ester carboxylesterase